MDEIDVLIMMGLPGSGKTTLSRAILEPLGKYDPELVFSYNREIERVRSDPNRAANSRMTQETVAGIQQRVQTEYLHECYERMIDREENLPVSKALIVVDNNNVSMAEVSFYVKVAQACGLRTWIQCVEMSQEGIPQLAKKSGLGQANLNRKLRSMKGTIASWPRCFPPIHINAVGDLHLHTGTIIKNTADGVRILTMGGADVATTA